MQRVKFEGDDFVSHPNIEWTLTRMREICPTVNVSRGANPKPPSVLPYDLAPESSIESVPFQTLTALGEPARDMTFGQAIDALNTEAIIVMHKGRVVYEKYLREMQADTPHLAMSVTKSFMGTMAQKLLVEGLLDETKLVPHYLPQMAGTAYADATVRQVMDMQIGVKYSENYEDPKAEIWNYGRSCGLMPRPADYNGPPNLEAFLKTTQKEGEHGVAFAYKTICTEVLAWIVRSITGQSSQAYLSSTIWQKLGAEFDAHLLIDPEGIACMGGGLNPCLRDMARFGECMRLGGHYNGAQIIPKAVIDDIQRGASTQTFKPAGYLTLPNWSYRSMWWVDHNRDTPADRVFMARGIHGQNIYVDPKAEMTIARFACFPKAGNMWNDPITLPAYRAMGESLTTS